MKTSTKNYIIYQICWCIVVAECLTLEYIGQTYYNLSGLGFIVAILFLPSIFKDVWDLK